MVNIVIPSCGNSEFFKGSYYPKTLYEINGSPMIQQVILNYSCVKEKHFIFLFLQQECDQFHTDDVAALMTDDDADIIRLKNITGGALCTCLMAVDYIDSQEELIIANNDQIIDVDYNEILDYFHENRFDCGVICFESLHPRCSYIKTDTCNQEQVIEAVEKRPVSHKAIAGFYYFRTGHDFIDASKTAILKGAMHENKYYLTSAINEMILNNKKAGYWEVQNNRYHSFYTPERIRIYENGGIK